MSDRLLVQEFQGLNLADDTAGSYTVQTGYNTDYRPITGTNNQYWVSESKIDLAGYVREDLTVYFRSSFSQFGGQYNVGYTIAVATGTAANPKATSLDPYSVNAIEQIMVSSVPMTDQQLRAMVLTAPGFIPFPDPTGTVDNGNFNRTHIIHGQRLNHMLNTTLATTSNLSTTAVLNTAAYLRVEEEDFFSSLEPTAADALYCYRVLYLTQPRADDASNGISTVAIPPCRVILDSATGKEEELEYMMRLKRSYELANQV